MQTLKNLVRYVKKIVHKMRHHRGKSLNRLSHKVYAINQKVRFKIVLKTPVNGQRQFVSSKILSQAFYLEISSDTWTYTPKFKSSLATTKSPIQYRRSRRFSLHMHWSKYTSENYGRALKKHHLCTTSRTIINKWTLS